MVKELGSLPRAREIPPLLGKRGRSSGGRAAGGAALAQQPDGKPLPLDPTSLLLMEAAGQLRTLLELQAQRRALQARHGRWLPDADSCADSDAEGDDEEGQGSEPCDPYGASALCAELQSLGGSFGAESASAQSASLGAASSLGGRSSEAGSLRRGRQPGKRSCLERQYAVDLDGLCRSIGQRLPLPQPDAACG